MAIENKEIEWDAGSKIVTWFGADVLKTDRDMTVEDARELLRILRKYGAEPEGLGLSAMQKRTAGE